MKTVPSQSKHRPAKKWLPLKTPQYYAIFLYRKDKPFNYTTWQRDEVSLIAEMHIFEVGFFAEADHVRNRGWV